MGGRTKLPVVAAYAFAAAAAGSYVLAAYVQAFARIDARAASGLRGLDVNSATPYPHGLIELGDQAPFAVIAALALLIAILLRRPRAGMGAAAILVGANLTTALLKRLMEGSRPEFVGPAVEWSGWPSGHATAVMSLALALAFVTPPNLRPAVAAVGAAIVGMVGSSLVLLSSHLPSDVAGGFLIAATWASSVIAIHALVDRRDADSPLPTCTRRLFGAAAVGALALALVVVWTATRAHHTPQTDHGPLVASAAALSVLAVAIIAVAVRISDRTSP